MAVFLGRPTARPLGPRAGVRAGGVRHAFKAVEQGLIGGQGFLGDHVADEDDEDIVGKRLGSGAEFADGVFPVFRAHIRKKIVGLPTVLYGFEQLELAPDKILHARDDFSLVRIQRNFSISECLKDTADGMGLYIDMNIRQNGQIELWIQAAFPR